jgi:hypothetical protein
MVNKKKKMPAVKKSAVKSSSPNESEPKKTASAAPTGKLDLQACQDLYELAMVAIDDGEDEGFKRHMTAAINAGEKLLKESKTGQAGSDTTDDITEFVAESCYELGTFLQEKPADNDPEGANCAPAARPYLERAVDLYRGQADASQSFCRPAVVALSAVYAEQHLHSEDIQLCLEFIGRLTKHYNEWTPLQNDVLRALAVAYNNVNRLHDTEETYKKIVTICKTNYGDENEHTTEAEAELLEYLEDREFGLCECQMTPEQIAEMQKRLIETAAPK